MPETSSQYLIYTIRQRGKRPRVIEEPVAELKTLQSSYLPMLEEFPLHEACMARRGHSILDNAYPHQDAQHLLKIDIHRCYPSITGELIEQAIRSSRLPSDRQQTILDILPSCLIQDAAGRDILPTGAPTSPILCNIALTPVDQEIEAIARAAGYRYTRYMDDIHLSTNQPIRDWNLLDQVRQILHTRGLRINTKKTKWLTPRTKDRLVITGVSIQGSPIPRDFRRMLRAKINNLAGSNLPIDQETQGCLAYVNSISEDEYRKFLTYYEQRLERYGFRPSPE